MTRLDVVFWCAMFAAIPFVDLMHLWEMGVLGLVIVGYGLIRRNAWRQQ